VDEDNVVDLKKHRLLATRGGSERAARAVEMLAARAQRDLGAFFELVMREEFDKGRIRLAAHQRVLLDFISDHEKCVVMMPAGSSKTFICACITLWLLGRDPTERGAVVSENEGMAAKVLAMVAEYIEHSVEIRNVFPKLQRSIRYNEPWTQTAITVDRPYGIRDASVRAYGQGGKIQGSRLSWIVVDDLCGAENSATKESRDKIRSWFDSDVKSRLPIDRPGRLVVTNTARHPDDLMHTLRREGWPTLRMDIMGGIEITDGAERLRSGKGPWTSPYLRLLSKQFADKGRWRLVAHDPDPDENVPLWPERWPLDKVEELRRGYLPHEFNKVFMNITRDDASAQCKTEWVEECKRKARDDYKHFHMVSTYRGPNHVFVGVDLAFRKGEHADYSALFTFEQLPDGHRKILDVEFGQWDAPTVADKIIDRWKRYSASNGTREVVVRVEDNGAQLMLLQFMRKQNVAIPLKAHTTTGLNKHKLNYGVQSVFMDMMNGAWLIPNGPDGKCHPAVQKWIDECLYYTPSAHTGDLLMSAWIARCQAAEWGVLGGTQAGAQGVDAIGQHILSR